jgi:hypothetical protein
MSIQKYVPTVRVEGEIVSEPLRTTVTRVFYERAALKVAPFVLALLWLYIAGGGLVASLLTTVVIFVVATVFFPQIGHLGSLGSGAFRMVGTLLSGISDTMDGVIGPNKGQVPVLLLDVQSAAPPTVSAAVAERTCPNEACGHVNHALAAHCIACGVIFGDGAPIVDHRSPSRNVVRIEGQIVGGEPRLGHRVSIEAFDHKGTLLFLSGIDHTTGAQILVKRNADTGSQQ